MTLDIVVSIDSEIQRLQQARNLIAGVKQAEEITKRGPGRPPKAKPSKVKGKRVMSAEGKARIAAAQKKRWAAAKKANR